MKSKTISMNKQMVAVWGSNGGGKSTVSLALASAISKLGKNVVVVNADLKTPSLAMFLPKAELSVNNSLGTLLNSDVVNYDSLRSKIHIHPQSKHIGFIGLVSGENPISTQTFKREKIIDLLRVLDEAPFDVILFDCDSNTFFDTTTLFALEISDHVLEVLTPDVKGLEFEKSAMSWMRNSDNFAVSQYIKVLNMLHDTSPVDVFAGISGNVAYTLPFSDEVYNRFSAGELITNCTNKKSQQFECTIDEIVREILIKDVSDIE